MKQEPSSGLVNIKQVFTPQPDGTIGVEYSGTYGPTGPTLDLTGSAVPVNAANTRLSLNFFGPPLDAEPGNYWIIDYAPDYSWAIISDSTGSTGTILTRDQVVSGSEYDALVARAYRLGVKGTMSPTAQFPPA